MARWLSEYLNSDLRQAQRDLEDTITAQHSEMASLLLEVGQILGVPTAPSGVNGLFRREDFVRRAREVMANEDGPVA